MNTGLRKNTKKNTTKALASIVLVVGAASVAGLGTFGSFTSTTSASADVATGKVVLNLTQHATRGTDVAATNMVPGDTVQRSVVLTRSSDTETFGSVKLTTTAANANLLTDAAKGLTLTVDQCSTGWTKAAGASNELTCAGTTTNVVATRPVVGANLDLGAATTALNASGAASNLRLSMQLPQTAGNELQGLANTVTFTFDATQRAATFK